MASVVEDQCHETTMPVLACGESVVSFSSHERAILSPSIIFLVDPSLLHTTMRIIPPEEPSRAIARAKAVATIFSAASWSMPSL